MNTEPHSHRVELQDHTNGWYIAYGDRYVFPSKPVRWPWDTEEAYAKRCVRSVKGHVRRLVLAHDRGSRAARHAVVTVPEFPVNEWASDHLS